MTLLRFITLLAVLCYLSHLVASEDNSIPSALQFFKRHQDPAGNACKLTI